MQSLRVWIKNFQNRYQLCVKLSNCENASLFMQYRSHRMMNIGKFWKVDFCHATDCLKSRKHVMCRPRLTERKSIKSPLYLASFKTLYVAFQELIFSKLVKIDWFRRSWLFWHYCLFWLCWYPSRNFQCQKWHFCQNSHTVTILSYFVITNIVHPIWQNSPDQCM